MDAERAIFLIREYRRYEFDMDTKMKKYRSVTFNAQNRYWLEYRCYGDVLCLELIRRIKEYRETMSPLNAIRVFYHEIDDILLRTEVNETSKRCKMMEQIIGDILDYLWEEDHDQME